MDGFEVVQNETVTPSHQVTYYLGCTHFLFSRESVCTSLNQFFVEKGEVICAVFFPAMKGVRFREESRCVRRNVLFFSDILCDVPHDVLCLFPVCHNFYIVITAKSLKEGRTEAVHVTIALFRAPVAVCIDPRVRC